MSTVVRLLVVWAALFGIYLLLVDQLVGPELLAGGISSLLVAVFGVYLHRRTVRRYRLVLSWKLRPFAVPVEIVWDSLRLLAAALHPRVPEGATRTIGFDSETGIGAERDAARRALVVARLSLAPNSFVVLRQREPGRLLMHDLLAGPDRRDDERVWPS